ncbi:uncharacterized protein LOC127252763 [Andrographis paniculata]|uniref:uncharacterized protein LOC127252763 n=1 Tax=Andrographis paniculata TaxID=175694 RepID=UPI0021E9AD02|nr:uncharacterized protein LOC127252763 [Andrographis paniculata]XP_051133025.1 uncharacterized protein LOC127252763 [Andrographis paniculata]
MAAMVLLDMVRRNPHFGAQAFNSRSLFTTKLGGASTAAASFAFATPFAFGALFGNGLTQVAYCDAGATLDEDYISSIRYASGRIFNSNALNYSPKQYNIQLKPLFSAFHWKTLALTSLRSFLLFYLPLVEPQTAVEDADDEDFLQENPEEKRLDLIVPFKKSVKQIVRETSVVTTRRVLERLAVHYVSQRMAWKLLKDVPKSATRKAARGMPTTTYAFCVSRTTFRGHCLGILASWIVQVGIDIYRFLRSISKPKEEGDDPVDTSEQARVLVKKVCGTTVRCGASLIFASIAAGIGATFIRPSAGQWIGCALGDLSGPVIVAFCFEKLQVEL